MSEKKRYEKLLKEKILQEYELGNYELIDTSFYLIIKFYNIGYKIELNLNNRMGYNTNVLVNNNVIPVDNNSIGYNDIDQWFDFKYRIRRKIVNKYHKLYKEWLKEKHLKDKMDKEAYYTDEIAKLLKVRPADKDLQLVYKNASRRLEISKEIIKLTNELKSIKG